MKHNRFKLTNASIRSRCLPPEPGEVSANGKPVRQKTYWDKELSGFGLIVRPPKDGGPKINASFILQREVGGKAVKVTIGPFGAWTVAQARKRARELRVEMDRGINPNAEKKKARARRITLADAIGEHIDNMRSRERAERSIEDFEKETTKHLGDWLKKPLSNITAVDCRGRHKKLTKENGPYLANRIIRHLRACWNTAVTVHPEIPARNPTKAVVYNREHERKNAVPWDELPTWWAMVHEIANPVLRDLQLFYLFTGLRRNDGKEVRWEHVDFTAGTIHRPRPKGGVDRAFTVPLASFILDMLRHRREENRLLFPEGDEGWAYPSMNRKGEITRVGDAREQRYGEGGKKLAVHMPSPHGLRHTFATAGHEAYLRELDLKILMNHAAPKGNVTQGYIHPSLDHLRGCVEKIAAFLLEKAGVVEGRKRDVG